MNTTPITAPYTTTVKDLQLTFFPDTLAFAFETGTTHWAWDPAYTPCLYLGETRLLWSEAASITHFTWETGIGTGVRSHYEGFPANGHASTLSFETIVWIEAATLAIHFEFVPLAEDRLQITEVCWPGSMEFSHASRNWYTLLNLQQGLLIPNDWPVALSKLIFDGHMGTAASYMPWFGQVKDGHGYLAICEQPWDAAYDAQHPANGPQTRVSMRWYPSLGKMQYRRTMCYQFFDNCDHNTLCKAYRRYCMEHGTFRSLREKALTAPVDKLIGAAFVHAGIKTHVMENSRFFDPADPQKNNHLTPFATRAAQLQHYHALGLEKLYLHLDGWAQPGYDNQHPDYLPACTEAGGWEGMKELADTAHALGYSFGIHDQYRDYYFAAKTFDPDFGTLLPDGTRPQHANWAGGPQTYLCATQAPYYVKRNFQEIEKHGIAPDCAYLDVFTCNEGDECDHPWHRMTRKECYDYRNQCFAWLLSQGILSSSEEVTDWAVPNLIFCHYAPYAFQMKRHGEPLEGIPVPLYNLVYHDAILIPWMMEKYEEEDHMLYALLNGGAPYFIRNGAYQNVDGTYSDHCILSETEQRDRCQTVMALHKKVALCEMCSHTFVNGDFQIQRTTFADGTVVTVDLKQQTWKITSPPVS